VQVSTVRLRSPGRPALSARAAAAGGSTGPPAVDPAGRPAHATACTPSIDLAATLYLPDGAGPFPGLVVAHGAGSNRSRHEPFSREACSLGFAVLSLDFRGHGDSGGAADGPLEDDIVSAAEFLRRHPAVDGGPVCYRGSSMGGFYGLKAAALSPVPPGAPAGPGAFAAVALLCPANEQLMLGLLEEVPLAGGDSERPCGEPADAGSWPASEPPGTGGEPATVSARWDLPKSRAYFLAQDSLVLAEAVRCPVLLVHARGDDVVPLASSLVLAEHLGGDTTLVALAGGSHTTAQHDPAIHRLTARWLLDQITSACTGRT
jgi:dipeptidyl aminopeptidase/acylaminoacyl peptidase